MAAISTQLSCNPNEMHSAWKLGLGQKKRNPCDIYIPSAYVQGYPPIGSFDGIENKRLMTTAESQSSTMQLISHERH